MAAKLTITVPEQVAEAARHIAEREGTTVSAMAAKGLRDQVVARAVAACREWTESDPELAAFVGAWRQAAEQERQQRWGALFEGDHAEATGR